MRTTGDELKKLKTEIDARLATFARPEDVAGVVAPLSGKLTGLQQDVQAVVKSETDRKATAERIVLSLELASLKRAIDRGNGFASELSDARKLARLERRPDAARALRRPGRADARRAAEGLQGHRVQDDRRRRGAERRLRAQ